MFVVMRPNSAEEQVQNVVRLLSDMGARGHVITGATRSVVELLEIGNRLDRTKLERAPGVEKVLDEPAPILAADRAAGAHPLEIRLGGRATLGGRRIGVIAGPCSVESEETLLEIAVGVAEAGAVALRGGAFKPRTSPYSFQGLEEAGLQMLAHARERTGLAVVTEVMCCEHVERVQPYADVLQVGSRNMHSTPLLKAVGQQQKPVLLKRGWCATLEEFLLAAEYIIHAGNPNVILCERGIRTHEEYVRNTLALSVVPEVKRLSNLPIIVDPSHGTGRAHLVAPMSCAAIACGADGLLIEVHVDPKRAWSDGAQTLNLDEFRALMQTLPAFARAAGREA
ncbi:MAG TPA: 3-deoxy-7-phosphoheptulonate synthase [Phycisphaerae bacterium]|nr:3-deoxy-7-phosphoheptulonate synthase [Phycisphaerae bacterium]HNU44509.1 3-deoxy-7-phosphoheptulonate synthase [Phycisphaerae bacterium]